MAQHGGVLDSGRFELMVWGYDSAPDGIGYYLAKHEIVFSRRDAIAMAESRYERGCTGVAIRSRGEVIFGEGLTDVDSVPLLLGKLSSSYFYEV